jgi:predicted peptidase
MTPKQLVLATGKSIAMAAVVALAPASAAQADQTPHTMTKMVEVKMDYLLSLPDGYDTSDAAESYPLIVFLHGGGAADLDEVAEAVPAMITDGKQSPFIVVSPRNPREEEFFPQEPVATLVEEIASTYKVDRDRIYLVGNSRGAFSAYQIIQNYPDVYAAVVAVSGGGIPHYLDRVRGWTPFWIFHGANDDTIKLSESVQMVQKLKDLGGSRDIRFTVLEGAGHSETDKLAFSDPALWEWLQQQTRVPPESFAPAAKSTDTAVEPAVVR